MKILIDQDEVMAKWNAKILEWFNEDYGTNWKVEDITNGWEMEKTLGPMAGPAIRSYMRWPEFYTRLDPVEGAVDGIRSLVDDGHEVRIVSSVPISAGIAYHGKCQWLRDHMPWFDLKNFFAVHKKDEVMGDILLDDGPHNIEAFKNTGRYAVVFDTPHNQNCQGSFRVKNWHQFLLLVKGLSM